MVLAALTNALRCVDKKLADVRIVVSGAGAAGSAIVTLLLAGGAGDVVVCDIQGILAADDDSLSPAMAELAAAPTRPGCTAGCTTRCAVPTCSSA